MNGLMLKAFGSAPGEDVGQLNTPGHVSLDDEERIIVADTISERVLLLNKQMMLQRVLVTWHHSDDAAGPHRVHYDSHSGKLLVGLANGQLTSTNFTLEHTSHASRSCLGIFLANYM